MPREMNAADEYIAILDYLDSGARLTPFANTKHKAAVLLEAAIPFDQRATTIEQLYGFRFAPLKDYEGEVQKKNFVFASTLVGHVLEFGMTPSELEELLGIEINLKEAAPGHKDAKRYSGTDPWNSYAKFSEIDGKTVVSSGDRFLLNGYARFFVSKVNEMAAQVNYEIGQPMKGVQSIGIKAMNDLERNRKTINQKLAIKI